MHLHLNILHGIDAQVWHEKRPPNLRIGLGTHLGRFLVQEMVKQKHVHRLLAIFVWLLAFKASGCGFKSYLPTSDWNWHIL